MITGLIPRGDKDFFCSVLFWAYPASFSMDVEDLYPTNTVVTCDADPFHPSSARTKKVWSFTPAPPYMPS